MIDAPQYCLTRATFDMMVEAWPFVRRGLLTIKRKDKHSGNWTIEHVRALLEASFRGQNTYELWLIHSGAEVVGFVVTNASIDMWLSVPLSLFAWLTYLEPEHMAAFHTIRCEFEKITRQRGLRWFEGMSSREGWVKRLEAYGYETHMILYRKDVWAEETGL